MDVATGRHQAVTGASSFSGLEIAGKPAILLDIVLLGPMEQAGLALAATLGANYSVKPRQVQCTQQLLPSQSGMQGAHDLGYSDVGGMWRSKYDMPPDAFAAEVDRHVGGHLRGSRQGRIHPTQHERSLPGRSVR